MCSNKDNINSFLFFIISSFMRKIHKNCNDHIHKLIYEYFAYIVYVYVQKFSSNTTHHNAV